MNNIMYEIRKKLEDKISKRIGLNAFTKDNSKIATIVDFTIETTDKEAPEERLTVNYVLAYGEGKNAKLRLVNEKNVVVLLKPNK